MKNVQVQCTGAVLPLFTLHPAPQRREGRQRRQSCHFRAQDARPHGQADGASRDGGFSFRFTKPAFRSRHHGDRLRRLLARPVGQRLLRARRQDDALMLILLAAPAKERKHCNAQGRPERHPGAGLVAAATARQLGRPDRFEPDQLEKGRGRAFGPAWQAHVYASVIALSDLAPAPCRRLWFPVRPIWPLHACNRMECLQPGMVLSLCCFMCVTV